ncbi:hypothetical protein CYMTET_22337 [Cymbomonas tetramitiformis]|uniref:Uncharacterized protein n=1 Tax=Cymbomonas tetramitiformis TaxID=36881 RepID=A0AAE0G037_9CHLO|nr:hypothetical protein CYMTET_22337 [Cymbomonas tetramitiformis]
MGLSGGSLVASLKYAYDKVSDTLTKLWPWRFRISDRAWYDYNNLNHPKRCKQCRQFRKFCKEYGDADAEEYKTRAGSYTKFRKMRNEYLSKKNILLTISRKKEAEIAFIKSEKENQERLKKIREMKEQWRETVASREEEEAKERDEFFRQLRRADN